MTRNNSQDYSDRLRKFVGIPYAFRSTDADKMDCWQLTVAVRKCLFGLDTPVYNYAAGDTGLLIRKRSADWKMIPLGDEAAGDVLILRLGSNPVHCGVVLDEGKFIHTLKGRNSCIEKHTRIAWRNRIEGIYRWQQ